MRRAINISVTPRAPHRRRTPDSSLVDSTREVVAGATDPDAVLGTERTTPHGGDRLQRAVPMVCGDEPGRGGVGRHRVHQESGSLAGWRRGARLSVRGGESGARAEPYQR